MKKVLFGLVVVAMLLSISACETMKGFGRDVQKAGGWVQEKAD
ncbi:MAG: entericidin A/B family lipoprotein [Desulfuromonadales bacterium]|nr:entericidin A/B family lipoprotein [Desulfuromonadales bacterium]